MLEYTRPVLGAPEEEKENVFVCFLLSIFIFFSLGSIQFSHRRCLHPPPGLRCAAFLSINKKNRAASSPLGTQTPKKMHNTFGLLVLS